jgi:hypothetical protein
MCPMLRYPILQTMLSPFRRSQQKTLTLVIAALVAEGALVTTQTVCPTCGTGWAGLLRLGNFTRSPVRRAWSGLQACNWPNDYPATMPWR